MTVDSYDCIACHVLTKETLLKNGKCTACRQAEIAAYIKQQKAEDSATVKAEKAQANVKQLKLEDPEILERRRAEREATLAEDRKQADFDARLEANRVRAKRELCRRNFLPFVMRTTAKYHAGWVHKDIARRLEKFSADVVQKKSPRLMLFMPPRHGKSQLTSKRFPAWHLGRNPTHEFINCSYAGSLSNDFSRDVRAVMRDPDYATLFPKSRLDPDSQSVEHWLTTQGGGFVSAGVGGGITGKGAHILVIDDPVKNHEDADNEKTRDGVYDWYTSTAYTRLAPGGGILIIMTRWHDDDLAGRLIREMDNGGEEWEIVNYPAVAEKDEKYRLEGQALHPERYPLEELNRIKRAVGIRDWTAMYQQNPVAEDGDYFTKGMIHYYRAGDLPPREELRFYQAWDLAIGLRQENDNTVGVTVGIDRDETLWLVDVQSGKWNSLEIIERILDTQARWKAQIVGIERGQIKLTMGPILSKRIRERRQYEFYLHELQPGRTDKVARARTIQARMQQGMVRFPKDAPWTTTLVNELLRFPHGVHDDHVDALAWIGLMLNEFVPTHAPKPNIKKSWRDKLRMNTNKRSAMSS